MSLKEKFLNGEIAIDVITSDLAKWLDKEGLRFGTDKVKPYKNIDEKLVHYSVSNDCLLYHTCFGLEIVTTQEFLDSLKPRIELVKHNMDGCDKFNLVGKDGTTCAYGPFKFDGNMIIDVVGDKDYYVQDVLEGIFTIERIEELTKEELVAKEEERYQQELEERAKAHRDRVKEIMGDEA